MAKLHKHGISQKLNNIFHLLAQEVKSDIPEHIEALAQQRREAKNNKERNTADQLRIQLHDLGREMKDGKDGYDLTEK